jgi:UDP-galactopyranose mutase
VHFVGRLATYRYYNMDQVIGQALTLYKKLAVADADEDTRVMRSPSLLRKRRAGAGPTPALQPA